MCAYSMVLDHIRGHEWLPDSGYPNQWPYIRPHLPSPGTIPVAIEEWEKLMEAINKAREFDKANKEPDCHDPNKAVVLDDLLNDANKKVQAAIEAGNVEEAHKFLDIVARLHKIKRSA